MGLSATDVARITLDVLTTRGLQVTVVDVKPLAGNPLEDGWRVTLKDVADRLMSVDVPAGPPAAIRTVVAYWADLLP